MGSSLRADVVDAVTFLSRFPLPRHPDPAPPRPGSGFLRFAPVAGLVVGAAGAAVLALAVGAHLPGLAGAGLAIAAMMIATGGLHEDGLADVADGFGGGRTRARKLEIMRDSRIGTFGAAAVALALLIRSANLAALADHGGAALASCSLVIAAVLSRAGMLLPLACLEPARADGLAKSIGRLRFVDCLIAAALAVGFAAAACLLAPTLWPQLLPAAAMTAAVGFTMVGLARAQIGGVTGDVVGATQQATEIAVLLTLSAGL